MAFRTPRRKCPDSGHHGQSLDILDLLYGFVGTSQDELLQYVTSIYSIPATLAPYVLNPVVARI
jgi:hypothetical protein